jgi:hypothetical protein
MLKNLSILGCSLLCTHQVQAVNMDSILDQCYGYLESHLCEGEKWGMPYHFYKPSIDKYSSDQWLWDSGAHMIVWSHKNVTNSVLDLRTMLQQQQVDGFIPEEIFWSDKTPAQDAETLLMYSNTVYSDITQMPVLPYSLKAIYEASGNTDHITEFLPPLVKYFQWWRATRDDGDGLVAAIHNWETGMDASPAYDPAFGVYVTEVNETSFQWLYPKFIEVIESYKFLYHWNVTEILAREEAPPKPTRLDTWFVVKDLALNCVYSSGWMVLAGLADAIGDSETAQLCRTEAKLSSDSILNSMWNAEQGHFQTIYTDRDGIDKFSDANTVQNLFPLLLADLPADKLELIVGQLKDVNKFNAPYSIPTVAMDDPQFCAEFSQEADLMWRGPIWGFTNWFLLEGLGLHQQLELQEMILDKWIALVDKSGIYEMYNPITAAPYGPEGLGMSTLVCDWIYRYGWNTDSDKGSDKITEKK